MTEMAEPEAERPEGVPTEHSQIAKWADLNPKLRDVVLHALNRARADLALKQAKSDAQQLSTVAMLHDMAAIWRQQLPAEEADKLTGQMGQMGVSMMTRMQGADHALLTAFDLAIMHLSEPK